MVNKRCKILGVEGQNAGSILVPERPRLLPCVDNVRKSNGSVLGKCRQEATAPVPVKSDEVPASGTDLFSVDKVLSHQTETQRPTG